MQFYSWLDPPGRERQPRKSLTVRKEQGRERRRRNSRPRHGDRFGSHLAMNRTSQGELYLFEPS